MICWFFCRTQISYIRKFHYKYPFFCLPLSLSHLSLFLLGMCENLPIVQLGLHNRTLTSDITCQCKRLPNPPPISTVHQKNSENSLIERVKAHRDVSRNKILYVELHCPPPMELGMLLSQHQLLTNRGSSPDPSLSCFGLYHTGYTDCLSDLIAPLEIYLVSCDSKRTP